MWQEYGYHLPLVTPKHRRGDRLTGGAQDSMYEHSATHIEEAVQIIRTKIPAYTRGCKNTVRYAMLCKGPEDRRAS